MSEPYESMTPEDRHLHTTTLKLREYIMTVYRDQAVEAEYRRLKKLYEDTLHRISMKQTGEVLHTGLQGRSPKCSQACKPLQRLEALFVSYRQQDLKNCDEHNARSCIGVVDTGKREIHGCFRATCRNTFVAIWCTVP